MFFVVHRKKNVGKEGVNFPRLELTSVTAVAICATGEIFLSNNRGFIRGLIP